MLTTCAEPSIQREHGMPNLTCRIVDSTDHIPAVHDGHPHAGANGQICDIRVVHVRGLEGSTHQRHLNVIVNTHRHAEYLLRLFSDIQVLPSQLG